jgi:cytoskeletal protein RodZ
MAKRETDVEPMDEEVVESEVPTVGERLRAAREQKKLSLEDIAAQTRIPQRHLESIENADWDKLPAPTYTVGFAKSYASAVGLDRTDIGEQLREEMGGQRFASNQAEVFEAADPARTMPKWLVLSAVVAVIVLIILLSVLNKRSLEGPAQPQGNEAAAAVPANAPAPPKEEEPTAPAAKAPVVVSATAPAWIQVTDQGKTLFMGELQPGQSYPVPPTAVAPLLKAGKPEALKITVGSAVAPPVGPAGKVASKVSLKGADLMRGGAQAAPATTSTTSPAAGQAAGNAAAR